MMNFATHSGPRKFSAESIDRFSVIKVPYKFDGDPIVLSKRFVVLAHVKGYAICIKATSKTEPYEADESRMKGCVYYEAGQIPFFTENTAIQLDNQFPIPHGHIEKCHAEGTLEIHLLPDDFPKKLREAFDNCVSLKGGKRERLKALL